MKGDKSGLLFMYTIPVSLSLGLKDGGPRLVKAVAMMALSQTQRCETKLVDETQRPRGDKERGAQGNTKICIADCTYPSVVTNGSHC